MGRLLVMISVLIGQTLAQACLSVPRKISLSGASFEREPMSIGSTQYGLGLHVSNDSVYLHPLKNVWCVKVQEKDYCDQTSFDVTDDATGKVIGRVELNNQNKQLFIFSVDEKGHKTLKKPYLKFTVKSESQTGGVGNYYTEFYGEAIESSKVVGTIHSSARGNLNRESGIVYSATRGLGGLDSNNYDLRGNSVTSKGCGAAETVPYAVGDSEGLESKKSSGTK